ncbi:Amino acid transporters [Phaffia rhodozyma]|uniref:Amino acid transporters n=1 Tax=Phaffia rhodozyma TaxID=264483 RepID=A0A0F7SFS2_PHARH|nr:Amino acid transporters [Phaffia rhodozyma]
MSAAPLQRMSDSLSEHAEKDEPNKDSSKNFLSRRRVAPKAEGVNIQPAEVEGDENDVFAVTEDGPDYRGVSFSGAIVLLLKQQVGLGVLSLPATLNTLGVVPGLILIIFFGIVATYGDYVVGQFRVRHPGVHTLGDIGYIVGGKWGRELMGWGFCLLMCLLCGSGILTTSIALNAITSHATCTIAFAVVAMVIIMIGASARTFQQISWMSWVGISCIIPAILLVTIACGISDRPANAPSIGIFDKELKAFATPSFVEAMVALSNVLFAFGGLPGFLPVIAEMKDPRKYTKAMLIVQAISIALYIAISVVLWWSCGKYIASPALGSAGPLVKKIAYGIALPGLLAGPIIFAHVASKFCFVRLLRGTRHLQESTTTHWVTWLSLVVVITGFSFTISQVIPFFNYLIGIVGAVLLLYANAVFLFVIGMAILGMGLYASIDGIKNAFAAGEIGRPFSCADNS